MEDKEETFPKEEPIVVPLTPPLSQPTTPQPTIEIKGGIDKVKGTTRGMTTDTGRFPTD